MPTAPISPARECIASLHLPALTNTGTICGSGTSVTPLLVNQGQISPGEFDVLDISGSASLGGTLVVTTTGRAGLIFAPDYSATKFTLETSARYLGNCNLNGMVTISDLGDLASHWQSSANWLGGDFNGDGVAVPEPASMIGVAMATSIVLRPRRAPVPT